MSACHVSEQAGGGGVVGVPHPDNVRSGAPACPGSRLAASHDFHEGTSHGCGPAVQSAAVFRFEILARCRSPAHTAVHAGFLPGALPFLCRATQSQIGFLDTVSVRPRPPDLSWSSVNNYYVVTVNMAKIAGIGRHVLLNSLENCAKTARDPRENENSAGLAAGETHVFLRPPRVCAAVTDLCRLFPICVGRKSA
jgi:hypothetical protein